MEWNKWTLKPRKEIRSHISLGNIFSWKKETDKNNKSQTICSEVFWSTFSAGSVWWLSSWNILLPLLTSAFLWKKKSYQQSFAQNRTLVRSFSLSFILMKCRKEKVSFLISKSHQPKPLFECPLWCVADKIFGTKPQSQYWKESLSLSGSGVMFRNEWAHSISVWNHCLCT